MWVSLCGLIVCDVQSLHHVTVGPCGCQRENLQVLANAGPAYRQPGASCLAYGIGRLCKHSETAAGLMYVRFEVAGVPFCHGAGVGDHGDDDRTERKESGCPPSSPGLAA
jgi:hypothetical protein